MRAGFLYKAAEAARHNVAAWKERFGGNPAKTPGVSPVFLPPGREGCSVIAEIKMASPSRGDLMGDTDPMRLPPLYASAGAAAVSVVVEEEYFQGSPELFRRVGARTGQPLLWKDFVVDPYQIELAAALGASAVLLIAGMLTDDQMKGFLQVAARRELKALVEVHDEPELHRALDLGARLIGVNNRNLATLEVDITVSERLAPLFPEGIQKVAESGIRSPEDVERMAEAGFDAVLIGESLITATDPETLLARMVGAGKKSV